MRHHQQRPNLSPDQLATQITDIVASVDFLGLVKKPAKVPILIRDLIRVVTNSSSDPNTNPLDVVLAAALVFEHGVDPMVGYLLLALVLMQHARNRGKAHHYASALLALRHIPDNFTSYAAILRCQCYVESVASFIRSFTGNPAAIPPLLDLLSWAKEVISELPANLLSQSYIIQWQLLVIAIQFLANHGNPPGIEALLGIETLFALLTQLQNLPWNDRKTEVMIDAYHVLELINRWLQSQVDNVNGALFWPRAWIRRFELGSFPEISSTIAPILDTLRQLEARLSANVYQHPALFSSAPPPDRSHTPETPSSVNFSHD